MKVICKVDDIKNMGVVSADGYLKRKKEDFNKPYLS